MFKPSRTEPLDAKVYAALSSPEGWVGPDNRRYTIKHFYNSDGSREGMKYHVRREGTTDPMKWDRIEKLYRFAELRRDPDVWWFFSEASGAK